MIYIIKYLSVNFFYGFSCLTSPHLVVETHRKRFPDVFGRFRDGGTPTVPERGREASGSFPENKDSRPVFVRAAILGLAVFPGGESGLFLDDLEDVDIAGEGHA